MNDTERTTMPVEDEKLRHDLLTLPNILSISRILLTPVFLWMMIAGKPREAFFVFLVAGATDALDGFAARSLNLRSSAGLWLDPAGDKILLTAAFIALSLPGLAQPNTLPLWLTGICVGRDATIVLAALVIIVLRGVKTFKPALAGKVSTICQVFVLYVVLFANAWGWPLSFLPWLYALTAGLTLVSWIQYGVRGIALLWERRRPGI